jgi:hypothetical protein
MSYSARQVGLRVSCWFQRWESSVRKEMHLLYHRKPPPLPLLRAWYRSPHSMYSVTSMTYARATHGATRLHYEGGAAVNCPQSLEVLQPQAHKPPCLEVPRLPVPSVCLPVLKAACSGVAAAKDSGRIENSVSCLLAGLPQSLRLADCKPTALEAHGRRY